MPTPRLPSPSASLPVSIDEPLDDRVVAPAGHHLHADRRHLHADEVVALAHVVAPRVVAIGRVAEVDRVLGVDRRARPRGLLERHAVLMALGDVHEGAAVGTEHPLVGREDQKVGIERLHVDVPHAGIVRGVDQQRRALLLAAPRGPRRGRWRRRPTSAPRKSKPAPPAAAPARSIAASTADVQSPSLGPLHRIDHEAAGRPAACHSSTGEVWSFSSTITRVPRGIGSTLPAVDTP